MTKYIIRIALSAVPLIIFATCCVGPVYAGKTVVTPSDFTFVGGFKMPSATPWLRGLSYRYKENGDLVLYSVVGVGAQKGNLIETKVPDLLTASKPFLYTSVFVNYGDIFQDKIVDLMPNGSTNPPSIGVSNGATTPGSVFWDEDNQRIYWTKVISYENTLASPNQCQNDASIGYSILNESTHTGTGIGEWRLDQKAGCGGKGSRYAFQMIRIPDDFSKTYLNGKKYALGFGGGVSIVSNGVPSIGPALSVLDHAPNLSQEMHLGLMSTPPTMLLSHFFGETRADLPTGLNCLNYRGESQYHESTTKWNVSDESYYGAWIDAKYKQGVLAFALTAGGNTKTNVVSAVSKSVFVVANIGDIRVGDIIRVPSDGAVDQLHYPFESGKVKAINGNEITLQTAINGNPVVGGEVICGTWYRGGGAEASRMWTPVYIYSEDNLAAVSQGARSADGLNYSSATNWAFPEVSYPLPGGAYGGTTSILNVVNGVSFDPISKRLYIMTHGANGLNDVYVYQLNDSPEVDSTPPSAPSGISVR